MRIEKMTDISKVANINMKIFEVIEIEQYTASDFLNPEPTIYLNDDDERCEFFTLYIKFKYNNEEYTAQADVDFDFANQPFFEVWALRDTDGDELERPNYKVEGDNKQLYDAFVAIENFIHENTEKWLKYYEVKAS